jgi:lauroyl/myristoyl acyltransferase
MRTGRLLARFLRTTWIVLIVRLFFCSVYGVRLAKALLLPRYLILNVRLWPKVFRYSELVLGERKPVRNLIRYYLAQADQTVWATLAYEVWDSVLRHHEFGAVEELRAVAGRGKGLLVLGMHYGPRFIGYLLYKQGLNPAILAARENIPDLDDVSLKSLVPNEYAFRGTYDGFSQTNRSEKSFVRMMLGGRPGMIVNDVFVSKNGVVAKFLGVDYPVAAFPFKLALKHDFPVAVAWLTRIKGAGYKLNVREIHFGTVEDGVAQYAALFERVVREDPFPWHFGLYYARNRAG